MLDSEEKEVSSRGRLDLLLEQWGGWTMHRLEYVIVNPETGENQRKHTFAVLHDGYIFASGWYKQ